jgi:non-specific serine/threonine protein kinase
MRLVTLLGPGGIGKTRLALTIAAEVVETFDDQVAWAPIATATTPETVAAAIAHAVGVTETGGASTLEALKTALRDERLLLVIDNFEQALNAAPLLSDLLQACPRLAILVTSRALLRIAGEHPIDVPPLSTDLDSPGTATTPSVAPAIELFAQRASSVSPSFILNSENAPVVTEICRRLDGLPLAIELAAARVNHMPLHDLRDRLDSRLALLAGGARDMPARHRTMRDAIAWSHDLLTADQQVLFRSLAVFAGGFTLDAAETVARDRRDVLTALSALVDISLVRIDVSGTRYAMLETVREFAVEQLDASGDEAPRRRHAEYFMEQALLMERTYWGDEPGDVRDLIRTEEANLRAAVGWAIAHEDVEMASRLAISIFDPLSHTSENAREQFIWLRQVLALPGGSPAARVTALTLSASLVEIDELAGGMALAEDALALAREHNDTFGIAESLRVLGNIAIHTGERARARECLLGAQSGFQDLGLWGRAGWTLHHLSVLEGVGSETAPARAAAYCEEALAIFRDLEHVRGIEVTLNWHAQCAYKLGDLPAALASAREGLVMTTSDSITYDYLDCFADIAELMGRAETATLLYGAADALRERIAQPIEPVFIADREARIAVARRALGEEAFAAANAAGRALTMEQAVAEALAVEIPPVRGALDAVVPSAALLSPRELEVMRLVATGLSDRAIAESLFIGERTVNTHVAHVFAKLGVRNRASAVTAAIAAGLVDPDAVDTDPA